jgi:hypothetical protein
MGLPAQFVDAGPVTAAAVDVVVEPAGVSDVDDEHAGAPKKTAHAERPKKRPRRIEELMGRSMMDPGRADRVVF